MNLKKIGNLKVTENKEFRVFENDHGDRYIEKETDKNRYSILRKLAELAKENDNIVQISAFHFSKEDSTKLYFYEPYLDGVTLETLINKKDLLSLEQIENIIYQMCLGINALHNKGIIHRDIKPANIFLTTTGVIKILDFDIAITLDDTNYYSNAGTKGYASPEQYGFDKVDYRSDIYSLGIVIEKLITNTLETESFEFNTIIAKATAVDINNRFNSVDEIIEIIATKKNKFFPPQLEQIQKGIRLGLSKEEIKVYARTEFNAMQMGVIKHALDENVDPQLISIIADSNFSSRQMYQIKRGFEDGLSISQINKYARAYLKPVDMAIYRTGIIAKLSEKQIYSRINYYNELIHINQFDDEQLAFIRYCLYQSTELKYIEIFARDYLTLDMMKSIYSVIKGEYETN